MAKYVLRPPFARHAVAWLPDGRVRDGRLVATAAVLDGEEGEGAIAYPDGRYFSRQRFWVGRLRARAS